MTSESVEATIEELELKTWRQAKEAANLYLLAFSTPPLNLNIDPEELKKEAFEWKRLKEAAKAKVLGVRTKSGKLVALYVGHVAGHDTLVEQVAGLMRGAAKPYFLREAAVHPDFRRRGLAKRLLEAQLAHARTIGCDKVFGLVLPQNYIQRGQLERSGFRQFCLSQKPTLRRGKVEIDQLIGYSREL